MRLYVGSHNDQNGATIARWFSSQIGKDQYGPFTAMGWVDATGEIRSAAIFNDYTVANIEIHIVGRMTRQTMREAFSYCFNEICVLRVTAKPHRSNRFLLRMLPKIGFVYEGTMRTYYGPHRGDDALVFRIVRERALKWMK